MKEVKFYGAGFPYRHYESLPGTLIVIEGTDGVGRSTQISLLKKWLEGMGYPVVDTGLRRSPLTQPGLDSAKRGHTFGSLMMGLFYATDFADRLERQIMPALESGFFVLADRYSYAIMARNVVRGADPDWVRGVFGFALQPDMVIYLKADIRQLVGRLLQERGIDYWESGMDCRFGDNLFDSFCAYQTLILEQYDKMAGEFGFHIVDANRRIGDVFSDIKKLVKPLVATKR